MTLKQYAQLLGVLLMDASSDVVFVDTVKDNDPKSSIHIVFTDDSFMEVSTLGKSRFEILEDVIKVAKVNQMK